MKLHVFPLLRPEQTADVGFGGGNEKTKLTLFILKWQTWSWCLRGLLTVLEIPKSARWRRTCPECLRREDTRLLRPHFIQPPSGLFPSSLSLLLFISVCLFQAGVDSDPQDDLRVFTERRKRGRRGTKRRRRGLWERRKICPGSGEMDSLGVCVF